MATKFESYRRNDLLLNETAAEKAIARILTQAGYEFVKQYPLRSKSGKLFYADILIPKLKLIVEVDGGYHYTQDQKRLDANRSSVIRSLGLHVYRFSNRDARNPEKVLKKIANLRRKHS